MGTVAIWFAVFFGVIFAMVGLCAAVAGVCMIAEAIAAKYFRDKALAGPIALLFLVACATATMTAFIATSSV